MNHLEKFGICPLIFFVALLWTLSSTFLNWEAQNWMQYSRWGLTRAEERGRRTSLLLNAPQDPTGLLGSQGTLLAHD